jgi:hypothetical protein
MGLYNVAGYDAGDFYGDVPKLQFYAEPFRSIAISYTQISLDWVSPAGDFFELRVVRSTDGFPETQEDGAIVYSWAINTPGTLRAEFIDGNDPSIPLVPGRFTYYRIWLKNPAGNWKIAAETYALLPIRHATFAPDGAALVTTKNKLLDILPRVFTTSSQSPIDEVDETADLSKFLDGPSFELDRLLTYAELLLPLDSGSLVGPEILFLQSLQLGLPIEPYLATKQQRRLAREALYIYQNKGTYTGLEAFVESLTGFAPDISPSPNLVLSPQDSSFTGGVGFWKAVGDATLELETTVPGIGPEVEPYVDDYRFVAKITANEIGSRIVTGTDDPIRRGTPVDSGSAYVFSGYGKAAEGTTMGVNAFALWYNYKGELIDIDPPRTFVQTPQAVTDDWTRFEFIGRAPGVVQDITAYAIVDGILTLFLSTVNIMVRGETIIVSGINEDVDGAYQIDSVGNTGQLPEGGFLGLLDSTFNQIYIETDLPDTPPTEVTGTLTEATPDTSPIPYVVMAGEIVDGEAEVTFAAPHDLVIGDKIVIQAMSTYFSYGVHTITGVGTNTVEFSVFEPFTGEPAEDANESFPVTGVPYGFAIKIIQGTGTAVEPAVYGAFELVMATEGVLYLDLFQMAPYTVQEFHEARGVEIFLNPSKSNFLRNPGFNPLTLDLTWSIAAENYASVDRTDAPLELIGDGYALEIETLNSTPTYAMAAYAAFAGVVTITMATPHDLSAGDIVLISGEGLEPVYGQHVLIASDATSISFSLPLPDTALTPLLAAVTHLKYVAIGYSVTSNVATVTLAAPHGIEEGQVVNIAGFGVPLPIWGQHLISAVDTSTISFALESPDVFPTPITSVVTALTTLSSTSSIVNSGRFISTSFYAKTLVEGSSESFTVVVSAVNALTQEVAYRTSFNVQVTDNLQRFQGSVFVPRIDPDVYVVNVTIAGATTGNTVYFDRAMVEDSFIATDYFDGDLPSSYGAVWESTPYASSSHLYPNLPIKITRLRQELENYLPVNTSFLIEWHGGGIAKPFI